MSTDLLRRMRFVLSRFWRRTLPQGLFGRSMVILITPLFLTLFIGLFVFFDRHWSTTTINMANSIAGEIATVAQSWDDEIIPVDRQNLIHLARRNLGTVIQYNEDANLPESRPLDLPAVKGLLKKSLQDKLDQPFSITPYRDNDDWVIVSVAVKDGVLDFYVPQKRIFSTTTYVFLLIMLGSGLLLSVVAVVFMRNQIRPIRKLAFSAEQFGKGIDIADFRPAGAREIRQASQAFLEMRDRIKRQIRQRTDMLSGVSHDLRTPLTRLKLQLEMLPKTADTEAMQSDIKVMEKMIVAYLDFARGESMETPLRCNLNELVQQAVSDAIRHGLDVTADLPEQEVSATIRPHAIQRVLTNILDNARLYAGKAWVNLNMLSRHAEIIIDDNGPGIPQARQQDVFKPFQRLDDSRNQDIEGTGLGLTIARDLVQSHGGTIQLDTAPQGGLRVIIHLPL